MKSMNTHFRMKKGGFALPLILAFFVLFSWSSAHATGRAGQCGAANGGTFGTAPSNAAQMCARGTASSATNAGATWTWTCSGSGTSGNANCSATNCGTGPTTCTSYIHDEGPVCVDVAGNNDGSVSPGCVFTSHPELNGELCSFQDIATTGPQTGTSKPNGYRCATNKSNPSGKDAGHIYIVDCSGGSYPGTCGPANGNTYATAGEVNTAGLCAQGSAADVTGSGPWSWTCAGVNGGANSPTCNASKSSPSAGIVGGCYMDTPAWDDFQPNSCELTYGCTLQPQILFSIGNIKGLRNGTGPQYDNYQFNDADYQVTWTGGCTNGSNYTTGYTTRTGNSWCFVNVGSQGGTKTATATVKYQGTTILTKTITASWTEYHKDTGSGCPLPY